MLCTFNLRCLGINSISERLNIFIYLRYFGWKDGWKEVLVSFPDLLDAYSPLIAVDCPIHRRPRWPWFTKNWPKLHLWRRSRLKPGDETMRSDEDERPGSAIFFDMYLKILFG